MEPETGVGTALGDFASEPLDVEGRTAHELGARFVAQRQLRAWLFVIFGVALAAGCFAGFGYFGGKEDALVKNGTHATATVTSAALYGGRYSRNSFNEHIDVEFAYPGGVAHGVRIYIAEDDRFRVGQQVEIVYDPQNPHRAALSNVIPSKIHLTLLAATYTARRRWACVSTIRASRSPKERFDVSTASQPRPRRDRSSMRSRLGRSPSRSRWPSAKGSNEP